MTPFYEESVGVRGGFRFHVCRGIVSDGGSSVSCLEQLFSSARRIGSGGHSLQFSHILSHIACGVSSSRSEGWEYCQIKRKLHLDWQFVKSFCCCATDPLVCVCAWHRLWPELDHPRLLDGYQATKWTAKLRTLLGELGIPDAQEYHGHDIRRGAAIDILSERSVAAMLQHCNWRTLESAAPYAPADEVQAGLVAQGFADESEPES